MTSLVDSDSSAVPSTICIASFAGIASCPSGNLIAYGTGMSDGQGRTDDPFSEIIRLDANGFPAFPQTPLPPWLENGARKAVNVCPALALRLTEAGK